MLPCARSAHILSWIFCGLPVIETSRIIAIFGKNPGLDPGYEKSGQPTNYRKITRKYYGQNIESFFCVILPEDLKKYYIEIWMPLHSKDQNWRKYMLRSQTITSSTIFCIAMRFKYWPGTCPGYLNPGQSKLKFLKPVSFQNHMDASLIFLSLVEQS